MNGAKDIGIEVKVHQKPLPGTGKNVEKILDLNPNGHHR
jgi:hypothetical protein